MHFKPKLNQRLTSLLMTTVMALTSITFTIQNSVPITVQAATTTVLSNNNMVVSSTNYIANLDNINPDDCSKPEYQMLRFSLIEIDGATSISPNGFVDRDDTTVIKNNPISVWNTYGAGATYFTTALSGDYIQQLVNPKYNSSDDNATVAHRLNSRRDYTASSAADVLSYGATWVPDNASKPTLSGHYELSSDSYFKTSYVPIYADESIPLIIDGGGETRSKYQQSPPDGHEDWATIEDNRVFFDAYTQTAFLPDEAAAIGVTQDVPDFVLRVLAIMMGYQAGPYHDKATFDEVYKIYKDYMASGKYELLVEPLQVFENTGSNSFVQVMFGDIKYVALTSAEVGIVDDCTSGILYGYSNQTNRNLNDGDDTNNNYNFLTGADSPTKQACMNLYNSLLLSTSDWNAHLLALSDGIENGNNNGAGDQFKNNITSTQNFLTGGVKSYDLGSALGSGGESTWNKFYNAAADSVSGSSGPYFDSIFYYQIYDELEGTTYNADTAKTYSMGSYSDPAGYITFGGQSIIKPIYSSLDIETNLVGVGEPDGELNGIPIYPNSYATNSDPDLSGTITFSGSMQLNFDDDATSWNEDIVTHINNGDPSGTLNEMYDPNYTSFTCAAVSDSNEASSAGSHLRYVHSIDDTSNNYGDTAGDVYIPANTVLHVEVTYADENGEPLSVENYYQIDGTQAEEAGEPIYLLGDNQRASTLFLDNIANLGWYKDSTNVDEKAIPVYLSRANAEQVLNDGLLSLSSNFVEDVGSNAESIMVNNLASADPSANQAQYISFRTLPTEYIPENAAYYLVTLTANIGSAEKHSDSVTIVSRPQFNQEVADSLSSDSGYYYAIYTDSQEECNGDAISSCVETDFTNNKAQLLIPISEPEYDVSADSIDINYSTESVLPSGSTDTSDARDHLTSLCLISEGSATEEVIKDFGDQVTSNTVYVMASTSPADTSAIYDIDDKDSLLNASTTIANALSSTSGIIGGVLKIGGAAATSTNDPSLRYIEVLKTDTAKMFFSVFLFNILKMFDF